MAEQPAGTAPRSKLGIATTSYMGVWRPQDTMEFLEHCNKLGAAGIQAPIHGDPVQVRRRAEELGMYVEAWTPLPKAGDASAFEQSLKAAQAAGAIALRSACLGSRRYETFKSLEEWRDFVQSSNASIAAALPILDRYKIPLGLENHKDWTADDMHALLEKHSNQYLGVCLDFGNNISLLDDPMYAVEKLAPYTVSTHLKDMAVEPCADGFLLSEVVLGSGILDLQRMIALVQTARPKTRLSLEMITRDPLNVPCLQDGYWLTFPERSGLYLERTLRLVEKQRSHEPLPRISQLSHDQQLRIENDNVVKCLQYAREHLALQ
ncbi:MAG: TIM barrel protein [Acidobacteriaceae bacterium]|nr:TIM barrel protein [Acidobacteriaceae bacterium]